MKDFNDKSVVITGAGSGIGAALVDGFVGLGAKVIAADINEGAAQAVADKHAGRVSAFKVNVASQASVESLAEFAFQTLGEVHVLFNNAGVFQGGMMWERPMEDYRWSFDVNVYGVLHGVRAFVPRMIAQDCEGHVVTTASVAAYVPGSCSSPYVVSKAAAFSVAECLALDLEASGSKITSHVLTPSAFDTGIGNTDKVRQAQYQAGTEGEDAAFARTMLNDMVTQGLQPADVVRPVLDALANNKFLIPTKSSYMEQLTVRFDALKQRDLPPQQMPD